MTISTKEHLGRLNSIYKASMTGGEIAMNAYNANSSLIKDDFHRCGKMALKSLARDMGLDKGDYDVRSNKGGIAVGGEITLHTKDKYIQISGSSVCTKPVLFRKCDGMKDYTGGVNNFCHITELERAIKRI